MLQLQLTYGQHSIPKQGYDSDIKPYREYYVSTRIDQYLPRLVNVLSPGEASCYKLSVH